MTKNDNNNNNTTNNNKTNKNKKYRKNTTTTTFLGCDSIEFNLVSTFFPSQSSKTYLAKVDPVVDPSPDLVSYFGPSGGHSVLSRFCGVAGDEQELPAPPGWYLKEVIFRNTIMYAGFRLMPKSFSINRIFEYISISKNLNFTSTLSDN